MVSFPKTLKHARMAACKGVTKITHKIHGWNKKMMIARSKGNFCTFASLWETTEKITIFNRMLHLPASHVSETGMFWEKTSTK